MHVFLVNYVHLDRAVLQPSSCPRPSVLGPDLINFFKISVKLIFWWGGILVLKIFVFYFMMYGPAIASVQLWGEKKKLSFSPEPA